VNSQSQKFAIWCGIGFAVIFFIVCWPMAQLIPPPSPTLSGEELMAKYADNIMLVRLAIPLGLIAAMLYIPWSALLSLHAARIEGQMPIMSLAAFGAGVANALIFFLPFTFWAPIFYRPERDPNLFLLLNDLTWLEFVMAFTPMSLQLILLGWVGLRDKSSNPVFPRWICFLSFWVALLFAPGGLAIYFKTGPFAWNGILAFWTPATAFGIYFCAMVPTMFKAITRNGMADQGN
jgi:hypothetical protein